MKSLQELLALNQNTSIISKLNSLGNLEPRLFYIKYSQVTSVALCKKKKFYTLFNSCFHLYINLDSFITTTIYIKKLSNEKFCMFLSDACSKCHSTMTKKDCVET